MIDISYFGIDLTTIKRAKIISINKRLLLMKNQENANNRFDQTGITTYLKDEETGENIEVSHIKIEDNNKFLDFVFGVNYVKSTDKRTPFVHIKMSVSSFEDEHGEKLGNNFKSLSIMEYRLFVQQVKEYLYEEYGILIDISEVEFENLEIANTFFLNKTYKEYSDTLKAMYMFAPVGMKKKEKDKRKDAHGIRYDDDCEYIATMFIGNGSVGVKAYCKSGQLEEKLSIAFEIDAMRVEVKVKNGIRCSQIFGKTIYEITDEELKEYYLERVKKDFIKGFEDYIKKGNKLIKLYIKEERELNPRGWTQKAIGMVFAMNYYEEKKSKKSETGKVIIEKDISMAFDVQQVLDIMRKEMKRKSTYDIAVRRMSRDIEKLGNKKNNLENANEIINKMLNV